MRHDNWAVQLIPIERILPNEEHDETRLLEVLRSIARNGRWTEPIVLERGSYAVMDGHHRLAAARRLSLSCVPCVLLDYTQVGVESRRPGYCVDGEQIVARSRTRELYPPKTTRHIFPRALPRCSIDLRVLATAYHHGAGRSSSMEAKWRARRLNDEPFADDRTLS